MLTEMFDNLLHIGNKTNYWNPEMKGFIHGSSNGVHIIDLTKTADQIEKVRTELQALSKEGKKILFVATKLQARGAFAKLAEENGHFFVSEKWVPGLLTNFRTIKTRIGTYLKLLRDSENGGMDMLTKKEKAAKMLELEKLDRAFRGVKTMKRTPDAIFVVDGVFEGQAVKEAMSLKLPCYTISNTNGNPFLGSGTIPANTNSVKSLDYLASVLKVGLKSVAKAPVRKPAPAKKAPIKKVEAKTEEK